MYVGAASRKLALVTLIVSGVLLAEAAFAADTSKVKCWAEARPSPNQP